jgi:hypothetical protein
MSVVVGGFGSEGNAAGEFRGNNGGFDNGAE